RELRYNKSLVNILRNKRSFKSFYEDSGYLIEEALVCLKKNLFGDVRSILHTIKGNSLIFDLDHFAKHIHHLEEKKSFEEDDLRGLLRLLRGVVHDDLTLGQLADYFEDNIVELKKGELETAKIQIMKTTDHAASIRLFMEWYENVAVDTVDVMLGPFCKSVEQLAAQKGKSVKISLTGGDLKILDPKVKKIIKGLIHVINNAFDHGIETKAMRGQKPVCGTISVCLVREESGLSIVVADDGCGINLEEVKSSIRAKKILSDKKMEKMGEEEILQLVFRQGVSTMQNIDKISGRGIGLWTIKKYVDEAGGTITIHTVAGMGSTIKITIPYSNNEKDYRLPMAG
ncbi:MAG: hypothetical protein HQK54_14485, partial [Oligoflexales bacterium]|nr:hypothetical protein [Oligoflexales bacterium]